MYDYIAFAWLVLTFFIALLLSIILTKKSALAAVITFLFSLILISVGPFILKKYLDDFLRPSKTQIISYKKLHFSDVLVIQGEVTNISKHPFEFCSLSASVFKTSQNSLKQTIYKLKPLRKKSILLQKHLQVGDLENFEIVFYDFTYPNDINVSVNSECY
ncbi:MAG: hypothetical protein PWQ42_642 [Sulfurospirillum sp.]|jgi:hypothetical protein|nr:hypothetical protein [Sulfurospirillum sp.]